jgi:hypothetical protein
MAKNAGEHGSSRPPPGADPACGPRRNVSAKGVGLEQPSIAGEIPPVDPVEYVGQLGGRDRHHRNRPYSTSLAYSDMPIPSCQMILIRSPRAPLKTHKSPAWGSRPASPEFKAPGCSCRDACQSGQPPARPERPRESESSPLQHVQHQSQRRGLTLLPIRTR